MECRISLSGFASRVGQRGVWGGSKDGGEVGRVGKRVGWYGQVADNIYTARKGVCN